MTICKRCVFFKDIVFIKWWFSIVFPLKMVMHPWSPSDPPIIILWPGHLAPQKNRPNLGRLQENTRYFIFFGGGAKLGVSNLPRSWGGGWLSEMRVIASCQWWPQHLRCWLIQVANRSCGRPNLGMWWRHGCSTLQVCWYRIGQYRIGPYWLVYFIVTSFKSVGWYKLFQSGSLWLGLPGCWIHPVLSGTGGSGIVNNYP